MPAGLPAVADEEIAFIEQWIDDGCPEGAEPPSHTDLASDARPRPRLAA